jgi:hypothetical protein
MRNKTLERVMAKERNFLTAGLLVFAATAALLPS